MRKKVTWMKKAQNMLECVASLSNGPLYSENFDLFYTQFPEPYRVDIVRQLKFKLQASVNSVCKFILAGHRGVGKSTELLRVSKLCNGYKAVFINAADASGPKGMEYTNLLVLIADKLVKFGVEQKYLKRDDDAAFGPLLDYWNSELQIKKVVEKENVTNVACSMGIEAEASYETSFNILNKLKTLITIGAKAGGDFEKRYGKTATVDEIIHTVIDKNDALFVQALNLFIRKLQYKMNGDKLLIIIEDLDKAGQFELSGDIFKNHIKAFTGIDADIIFTYPVHLQYDPAYVHIYDAFDKIYKLGVVELLNEDRTYNSDVIESFKCLVYKRIFEDLISEEALEMAIKMSGGLIRDVFTLLSEAAVIVGVEGREKITVADVEQAMIGLEDRYIKFIKIDNGFDKVVDVYNKPYRQVDENLRELLRAEVVLEYSKNRYVVHPIVLRFLHKIGKKVEKYG